MSADAAVRDLCAAVGVRASPLPLVLRFERSGNLHIERRNNDIIVYLARSAPAYRTGIAAAALRAIHPDRGLPFPVRVAFHGADTLVLLCRLPEVEVDLPTLDSIMQLLCRLADQAMAASG